MSIPKAAAQPPGTHGSDQDSMITRRAPNRSAMARRRSRRRRPQSGKSTARCPLRRCSCRSCRMTARTSKTGRGEGAQDHDQIEKRQRLGIWTQAWNPAGAPCPAAGSIDGNLRNSTAITATAESSATASRSSRRPARRGEDQRCHRLPELPAGDVERHRQAALPPRVARASAAAGG